MTNMMFVNIVVTSALCFILIVVALDWIRSMATVTREIRATDPVSFRVASFRLKDGSVQAELSAEWNNTRTILFSTVFQLGHDGARTDELGTLTRRQWGAQCLAEMAQGLDPHVWDYSCWYECPYSDGRGRSRDRGHHSSNHSKESQ